MDNGLIQKLRYIVSNMMILETIMGNFLLSIFQTQEVLGKKHLKTLCLMEDI